MEAYKVPINKEVKSEFNQYDSMRHYNIPNGGYFDYPFHFSYESNCKVMKNVFNSFFVIAELDLLNCKGINLVCRGSSGVFVSAIFYELLKDKLPNKNINIVYIRKIGEKSHCNTYNNIENSYVTIFVDDFIERGETIEACYNYVSEKGIKLFDWCVCSYMCSVGLDKVKLFVTNLVCSYDY
jgi:hypothetical protein